LIPRLTVTGNDVEIELILSVPKSPNGLAEICGQYLGKGQQVAIEGRIQTRSWDDDRGQRHWKTEVVAASVEMLSGRRKKDYEAETAADALAAQAGAFESGGPVPASEPIPSTSQLAAGADEADEDDEAHGADHEDVERA